MNKRRTLVLTWTAALLPLVLAVILYPSLPPLVPTHWNLDGTVDYSGKAAVWLFALLPAVLTALLAVLPKVDPRRENYRRFQGYYDGFALALALFLLGMNVITLTEAFRPGTISVGRTITVGLGILFAFLGNFLPKVKSNFFLGIKNPWTLSDPDVWNRTHRLGGMLFFALGVALVPVGLLLPPEAAFALLLAGALAAGLVPTIFSYIWYRQKAVEHVDKRGGQ